MTIAVTIWIGDYHIKPQIQQYIPEEDEVVAKWVYVLTKSSTCL